MNKTFIASAALALTAVFSTAVRAQNVAAPPLDTAPYHLHHRDRSPFMAALKQLDLSDAQKASIHQIFESRRSTAKAEHVGFREQRRAFAALDPSAADYQQQVNSFSDQAAANARQRMQDMAQIKSQVMALLTPAQKAQFLSLLANPPPHTRFAPPAG